MITVYCDICGNEIKEYTAKCELPEDQPIKIGHRTHECEKCKAIWKTVNIEKVLANHIYNLRVEAHDEQR